MEYFLQQLINGLALGSVYALIAIGYTLVYGIIGMINFAHGDVFMIGAFVTVITIAALGALGIAAMPLGLVAALILSVIVAAAYGYAIERVAYRPLRGSARIVPLISAIGVSMLLQNFVREAQGPRTKPLPPLVEGKFVLLSRADGFVVTLSYVQIAILVISLLLCAGLMLLVHRTQLGRAARACEQDMKMAALLGVPVNRIISLTFMLGAGLAAVAGLLVSIYYGVVDFYMGFLAGVKAFTAAVLGGIGNLAGAMLGGLVIGLVESFWSGYVSLEYKDVAAFLILIGVLLVRPQGLLGRPAVEKV